MSSAPKSLAERSLGGIFWILGGALGQSLIKLLVLAVLARLLTPTDFGVAGAVIIVISFLDIFMLLGVGPAIVQRENLTETHIQVAHVLSLALGFAAGAAFYFSAPLIEGFFKINGVAQLVELMAIVFPLKGMAVVSESLLQRGMRFRALAGTSLASFVFGYAPVSIVFAWNDWGALSLAFGLIAQAIVMRLSYLSLVRIRVSFRPNYKAIKQLLSFGWGHTLTRIGNFTALNVDYLVVGRWLGADMLGIYTRAYLLIMQPANLFGAVIDTVLFPAMASVQTDREKLRRVYEHVMGTIVMITMPLSVVLIIVAPELVLAILGAQWDEAVMPFQILLVTLTFRTAYKLNDVLARSVGAVYSQAWRHWVYAGAVFIGAYIGQFWGVKGVACGVGLAILLNFALLSQLCVNLIGASWRRLFKSLFRHFLIALFAGGVVYLTKVSLYELGVPNIIILLTVFFVLSGMVLCVYNFIPSILGEEGEWFRKKILEKIRVSSMISR